MGRDDTGRKRTRSKAEDALRASDSGFRFAFHTSPDAISINRLSDGRYLEVNDGFTTFTGYAAEEVLGKSAREITVWVDDATREHMAATLSADRMVADVEARCLRKDGSTATALFSASLIEVAGETCVFSVARDISRRKQAEDALKESETKYRIVAEFAYDWESWRSPDGTLVWVSPSCERITGYASDEFMSDPGLETRVIHDDDRGRVSSHFDHLCEDGPTTLEFRIVARNGETRWVEHVCHPVYDDDGLWLGRRSSARDVSERKRIEHEQEDFLAMVSHELRTPLTAIIGFAAVLQLKDRRYDADVLAKSLARISERAKHMQALVDELLQVTQLSSGAFEITRSPVDVRRMLTSCVESLGPHIQTRVRCVVGEDVGELDCDASRLAVVIGNLLSNADKFSPEGEPIHLTAMRADGGVAISVSDKGIGIDSDQSANVFDRFWQADMSTTRRYPGVGLGLFIVRQIVEAHGGWVGVRSRAGEGSVFRVWIPDGPAAEAGTVSE